MSNLTFDKLAYVDKLKAGGISPEQARVQADALDDALRDSVVTEMSLQKHLEPIRQDLALLKWGVALIVAAVILPLLKQFFE